MTASGNPQANTSEGELVIERVFSAPRELVWRAWTEPEQMKRWYGPKSMALPVCEIDLRVGGRYLLGMRSPQGYEHWTSGTYREIVPNERLVVLESMSDKDGNPIPPEQAGMPPGTPAAMTIIVTLEELEPGRTKLTLRHQGWTDDSIAAGAGLAWNEAFDKLAETLAA